MNVYGIIILVALAVGYLLELAGDLLNLRALRRQLPDELGDLYDPEEYARSQAYHRARTRLGIVASAVDLAALLVFWFAGGFQHLDAWLRGFGYGPIVTGVLFIGILVLAKGLLDLPFSVYSTFVVEERFGFNRTTPRTFALDLVKGLLLSVALGAPILALVLFFFERAGDAAWLYCWLATTAFTLFFLFVFPTWIMPLFNKFEPLEEGELRDALFAYARSVDFGLGGIFVVDGSRRSSKANAFFTGFGRNKRIALFDTLVEKHPARELVAVLAHEVGHYKLGHVFKNLAISVAHSGVLFFLLSIFLGHRGLYDAFFMAHTSVYAGLVFFGLLYAPIELILSLLLNLQLRSHEYQADRFAAETTGEPEAMVSALRRIAADSLSNLTPHPFYVFLNASHPPLLQRVRAIRAAAA